MIRQFKRSLILYSFFGILLTGTIIAVVSIVPLAEKLREAQKEQLVFAAKTRCLAVDEFLTRAKETAAQVTSRTKIRDMLEEYNSGELSEDKLVSFTVPKLQDALVHSENARGISRFDRTGNLLMQVDMAIPEAYHIIPGDDVVAPELHGPVQVEGQLYLVVSAPIINRQSDRVGTDIVIFDTRGLEEIIRDHEGLGATGETILGMMSSDTPLQFFATRDEGRAEGDPLISRPGRRLMREAIAHAGDTRSGPSLFSGDSMVAACYPVKQSSWSMVVAMNTNELYAPVNKQIWFIAGIIGLLLASGIAILLLLLRPLAHSVLVHTDKLSEQLKEKERTLEQLARAEYTRKLNEERMKALLKINQMTGADDREITDYALEEGVRLTESRVGYLHFLDEDQDQIKLHSWSSEARKHCTAETEIHYPLKSAGIWADSIRTGVPVIHNDYENSPGRKGYPEGHFPVTRHMSIPIVDETRVVGIAGVGNKEEPYDESDVRQLSLFMHSMWGILKQKRAEKEKEQLQSQLLQAQKMEVVGRFSGGIAHDFNNILTAILGYSELLLTKLSGEENWLRDSVQLIHEAGERGASLTRQLLAFSRKQVLDAQVVDINDIVTNMSKMLHRIIGEDVELKILPDESVGRVRVDVGQIEQVLMNLAVNARDAMPEGGTLTIDIGEVILDEKYMAQHGNLKAGPYVVISATDTGMGMPPEVKEKIFEPFFTTKEVSKGTGLGLATIFGIVKQHLGHITVHSEVNRGTTFKLYFPVTADKKAGSARTVKKIDTRGTETILVVDDFPSIRDLIRDTLCPLGYTILEVGSGEEALEMYRNADEKIDLLLTDVIMPGMKGPDLAEAIRGLSPGLKIVYMSGYTDDFISSHSTLGEGIDFINKPIIPTDLALKIRQILDR